MVPLASISPRSSCVVVKEYELCCGSSVGDVHVLLGQVGLHLHPTADFDHFGLHSNFRVPRKVVDLVEGDVCRGAGGGGGGRYCAGN